MKTPKDLINEVAPTGVGFARVNASEPKHGARDRRRFIKKLDRVDSLFEKLGFKLVIAKLRR